MNAHKKSIRLSIPEVKKSYTRKKNPSRGNVDRAALSELLTYSDTLPHFNQHDPIILNLTRKYAAGQYDPLLAPKLWKYWFDSVAQAYVKEYGGIWHEMFSVPTREAAAKMYADQIYPRIMAGEFDSWLGGIHAKRMRALRGGAKKNPRQRAAPFERPLKGAKVKRFRKAFKASRVLAPWGFVIVARKGKGTRLYYDAAAVPKKMTDVSTMATFYRTSAEAQKVGMKLLSSFPSLRKYRVTVEPYRPKK